MPCTSLVPPVPPRQPVPSASSSWSRHRPLNVGTPPMFSLRTLPFTLRILLLGNATQSHVLSYHLWGIPNLSPALTSPPNFRFLPLREVAQSESRSLPPSPQHPAQHLKRECTWGACSLLELNTPQSELTAFPPKPTPSEFSYFLIPSVLLSHHSDTATTCNHESPRHNFSHHHKVLPDTSCQRGLPLLL